MFQRSLNPSVSSSFLLLGPRGTGKSTFLRERFAGRPTLWVDLLDPETEHRFSLQPGALRELIAATPAVEWVVIDEIQKAPTLLDVVHGCIEGPLGKDRGIRFAMT